MRRANDRNPSEDQCRQRDPPTPRPRPPAEADDYDRAADRPGFRATPNAGPITKAPIAKVQFPKLALST